MGVMLAAGEGLITRDQYIVHEGNTKKVGTSGMKMRRGYECPNMIVESNGKEMERKPKATVNACDDVYFPPRVKEDQLDSLETVDIRFTEPASSLACICSA